MDLNNARVGEDFVDDVRQELQPNKFAVVAEIQEDWTTPVDSRMEAIGGKVYRRALSEVKQTVDDERRRRHESRSRANEGGAAPRRMPTGKQSSRRRSTNSTPRSKLNWRKPRSNARRRNGRQKPRSRS